MKRFSSLRFATAVAAVVVASQVYLEDAVAQRRGGGRGGSRGGGRSGGFSRGGSSRGFSRGGSSRGFSRSRSSSSRGFSRSSGSRGFSRSGSSRSIGSSFRRSSGGSSSFRRSSGSSRSIGSSFGRSSGRSIGSSIGSRGRSSSSGRSSGINIGGRRIGGINTGSRRSGGINIGSRGGINIGSRSGSSRSGRWSFNVGGNRGSGIRNRGSGGSRGSIAGRTGSGNRGSIGGNRGSSGGRGVGGNRGSGSGGRGVGGSRGGNSGGRGIGGNRGNSGGRGGLAGRIGSGNRGGSGFSIGGRGGIGNRGGRGGIGNRGGRGSGIRINIGGRGGRGGFGRGGFGRGGNFFGSRWNRFGGRGRGFRGGLRRSWGFWLAGGYGGWGIGFGRGFGFGGWGLGGWGLGGWGRGGWGVGSAFYPGDCYFNYGYVVPTGGYVNPYCDDGGFFPVENYAGNVYDYSQPVVGSNTTNDPGVNAMAAADEAFRQGNYGTALTEVDKAVKAMPNNADVHQFRSLVLFALGDYHRSAAAAHAALMGGPGWNWETLRSFYPSVDAYTAHLRRLEAYRSGKPAVDARFLLAYHYMMMNHSDAAAGELVTVINNQPNDKLAVAFLEAISKQTGKKYELKSTPELVPPAPPTPPTPRLRSPLEAPKPPGQSALAAKAWQGTWTAKQPDGTTITLQLLSGGKFRWTAANGDRKTTVEGRFTLQKDQLKLAGTKGGQALEGTMKPDGKDAFGLKLKYQPAEAPDLAFKRQ